MVTKPFYVKYIHDARDPRSPEQGYNDTKLKTFEDWKKSGFHVLKGQKSKKRSDSGKALFSRDQVEENYNDPGDIDMQEDYDRFMDEYGHDRDWT